MLSTFFGLEVARRGLEAQQTALDITGQNIANSNTIGYTRQIANLQATTPYTVNNVTGQMSIGSGVTLQDITRARDAFVDRQLRLETSKQEYWTAKEDTLSKIEDIFNETSDYSISNDLENFWSSWSDLAANPENRGARSVVKERTISLTDSFHHVSQQLEDMKTEMDDNVKVQIGQINVYAEQIKDLNNQINKSQVAGDNPNDLMDQRDKLVDELSQIINVKVVESKDSSFTDRTVDNYTILIGNENTIPQQVLVNNGEVNLLKAGTDVNGYATVTWNKNGETVDLGTYAGTLQANLEMRDSYLVKVQEQFDALAQGVASAINALHQTGQGLTAETGTDASGNLIGINFFTNGTGTTTPPVLPLVTAANITLNSVISDDVSRISTGAIASTVSSGDATVANAIAAISSGWSSLQTQIASGAFGALGTNPVPGTSVTDFYSSFIAEMGVDVQASGRISESQSVLVKHLTTQRESLSGVSLDEEMTNLVRFQKSYTAAARLVTMMDDMLDTIVSGMGITR